MYFNIISNSLQLIIVSLVLKVKVLTILNILFSVTKIIIIIIIF